MQKIIYLEIIAIRLNYCVWKARIPGKSINLWLLRRNIVSVYQNTVVKIHGLERSVRVRLLCTILATIKLKHCNN